jgi:hypothetical protein
MNFRTFFSARIGARPSDRASWSAPRRCATLSVAASPPAAIARRGPVEIGRLAAASVALAPSHALQDMFIGTPHDAVAAG